MVRTSRPETGAGRMDRAVQYNRWLENRLGHLLEVLAYVWL